MWRTTKFAYALFLATSVGPSAEAQTPIAEITKTPHQCVFGTIETVFSNYSNLPETYIASIATLNVEFDKGGLLIGAVCNNAQYLKLPPEARQLFDRQVQSFASCADLMAAKAQAIDLNYVLRIAQRQNALLQSLADLLKYGEIREQAAGAVKEGTKRALGVVNNAAGFQGKIGKVFEAAEGALTATSLAGDVVSDSILDRYKDRVYDALSEPVGNATKLLADDAFKSRLDAISRVAACQ